VLELTDVPKPSPRPNEVLVRVIAATVNRTDCGFRKAEPWIVRFFSGLVRPKRRILGNEFAGEIEAVGAEVTRFGVGDRVAGLTGDDFGAHAEYVCVPATAPIVAMPARLPPEQATALWDGPWLALTCLRQGGLAAGESVLIYGASGSIGSSAVQLAKHFEAHVTAVCGTHGLELVKSLGADEVIDYTQTDFTRLGREFDLVLDAVGKSTFSACKPLLKARGRFVATDLGPWWQNALLGPWTKLIGTKRASLAIPDTKRTRADIEFLKELAEAGKLKPILDRTYPLEQIVDAHRYVDTEQKLGSVVIRIAGATPVSATP
jgi:NADPH:quinone reductase-like Zn-dependent oxidoreductase